MRTCFAAFREEEQVAVLRHQRRLVLPGAPDLELVHVLAPIAPRPRVDLEASGSELQHRDLSRRGLPEVDPLAVTRRIDAEGRARRGVHARREAIEVRHQLGRIAPLLDDASEDVDARVRRLDRGRQASSSFLAEGSPQELRLLRVRGSGRRVTAEGRLGNAPPDARGFGRHGDGGRRATRGRGLHPLRLHCAAAFPRKGHGGHACGADDEPTDECHPRAHRTSTGRDDRMYPTTGAWTRGVPFGALNSRPSSCGIERGVTPWTSISIASTRPSSPCSP